MSSSFLNHILSYWAKNPRGRLVLTAWATVCAGLTLKAAVERRRAKRTYAAAAASSAASAAAPAAPSAAAAPSPSRATTIVLARRLVPSGMRSTAGARALGITATLALRRWAATKLSSEIGHLGGLLAARQWEALFARQVAFASWAFPAAALTALADLGVTSLEVDLRRRLEAMWREFAARGALHRATSGVPLQALTTDSDAVCREMALFLAAATKPAVDALLLSTTLARTMGAGQFLAAVSFLAVAGAWVRSTAPAFAPLREAEAEAAASLAESHAFQAAQAEQLDALDAHAAAARVLESRWAGRQAAAGQLAVSQAFSSTVETYALRHVGVLAAFNAMIPAVYYNSSHAGGSATSYFLSSLHLLVDLGLGARDAAAAVRAKRSADGIAARVCAGLDAALAEATARADGLAAVPTLEALDGAYLVADALDVAPPFCEPVLRGVGLTLRPGDRWRIAGPNGAGKSALLRTLAGWWPARSGRVLRARGVRIAVLPQTPFMDPSQTLREALAFPGEPPEVGDGELRYALIEAGLEALLTRVGLDGPCEGLSGGEAQRLAAARALLGRPEAMLLDEPTAATSAEFAPWLFGEIKRRGIAAVVVTHQDVPDFFTKTLTLGDATNHH